MDMMRFFILVSLLLSFNRCRAQQQPTVVTRTFNATDRDAFNYSGGWRRGGGTCDGGMLTSTPGSSVSFRFTGAELSFVLHGVSETQREALSVTLDGSPVAVPTLTAVTTPDCGRESVRVTLPSGAALEPTVEHTLNITLRKPVAPSTRNNIVVFSASFSAPSVSEVPSSSSSPATTLSSSSVSATSTPEPMTALDTTPSSPISPSESAQSTPAPVSTAINARSDTNRSPLSAGAIVGIIVGAVAVIVIGVSALLCTRRYDRRHEAPKLLSNQDLERLADRAVNAAFPLEPTADEPIKGLADGAIHVVLPFTYAGSASEVSLDKKDHHPRVAADLESGVGVDEEETAAGRSMFDGFGWKGREAKRSSQHESFLPLYVPPKLTKPFPSSPTVSTPTKSSATTTTAPAVTIIPPSSSNNSTFQIPRPSVSHLLPRLSTSLSSATDNGYSPARDHPDGMGLKITPARRPSYAKDMFPVAPRRPSTANSGKSAATLSAFGLGGSSAGGAGKRPGTAGSLGARAWTAAESLGPSSGSLGTTDPSTVMLETTPQITPGSPVTPQAPLRQEFDKHVSGSTTTTTAEPLFYLSS